MRIRIALLSGLVLLAGGTARADSFSLIWQATGTSFHFAPGQNEVLLVVLTISSPDIHYAGVSVEWQVPQSGGQVLFDQTSCVGDFPGGTNWEDVCLFQQGDPSGDPGQSSQYGYNGPLVEQALPMDQATATIGTITFDIINGGFEQISFTPGFFNEQAFDSCVTTSFAYCTGRFTMNPATAQLVPEPGTLALLALGVTALTLGRSRSPLRR